MVMICCRTLALRRGDHEKLTNLEEGILKKLNKKCTQYCFRLQWGPWTFKMGTLKYQEGTQYFWQSYRKLMWTKPPTSTCDRGFCLRGGKNLGHFSKNPNFWGPFLKPFETFVYSEWKSGLCQHCGKKGPYFGERVPFWLIGSLYCIWQGCYF